MCANKLSWFGWDTKSKRLHKNRISRRDAVIRKYAMVNAMRNEQKRWDKMTKAEKEMVIDRLVDKIESSSIGNLKKKGVLK